MTKSTIQPRANKTDAGNGSKAIYRGIDASRSPSPDPGRSANQTTDRPALEIDIPMTSPSEALTSAQPAEFYELLSHIERRPGMYLGSDVLLALEHYLSGYDAACKTHGQPQLLIGREFARWLCSHKPLPIGGEANGPFGLIKLNSPDPLTAWTRFFDWFREYHAVVSTQKHP